MQSSDYAPIVLFVYNRPEHTKQTLDALKQNHGIEHTKIYVFADGPKKKASAKDHDAIKSVIEIVNKATADLNISLHASDSNLGLASSVIKGVKETIDKYGKVIVLEDDLLCAPYFLQFMNDALMKYENNGEVMLAGGFHPPIDVESDDDTYFLKYASSWGWATWKDRWDLFMVDTKEIREEIDRNNLKQEFDFDNSMNFYQMLKDQEKGKIDSWAIRWNGTVFLKDGLGLYPSKSLVRNIGFDGSGEHCETGDWFDVRDTNMKPINLTEKPIEEDKVVRKLYSQFYSESRDVNLLQKIKYRANFELKSIKRKFSK